MCDHDNRLAACRSRTQFVCNQLHVFSVQTTGGLVQNQDIPVGKQRTGDGEPLLLPARQGGRMLVPVFIQPQPFEKRPRFFTRFLRRLRVQKQLFGNAGGKELRTGVVAAIVDVFAQLGCSGFLSVQEYLSAGFPRKAGKQQGKRRLSRAVSPATT